MLKKNPDAFRNISEVSTMLEVPTHVLRFWETRFIQLKPIKRGGRRYYRPEDIVLLRKIQDLLYRENYTIKGAQQVLKSAAKPNEATGDESPMGGEKIEKALALLSQAQERLSLLISGS